jgi:hypothetical protein
MNEWAEDDIRLKIFMVTKGLYTSREMDKFLQIFEGMYPPFTQKELDIADKMENAFKEYEKKNHNIFRCVHRVISKVILFVEENTRKGMKDEQLNKNDE